MPKKTIVQSKKVTPLMQQYNAIKSSYPDALLLFRIGDFYETFGEDAKITSSLLGIVLTFKNTGAARFELAGFPHQSLGNHLPKLVQAGHRVAICDQLEDPKKTKTIVKRGVTELITPGVVVNDQVLEQKKNNFLASIYFNRNQVGVSFLDVSTGEFLVAQGDPDYIDKLLQGFHPSEVIFQPADRQKVMDYFGRSFYTYELSDWVFTLDYGNELLLKHFGTNSLKGFGIESLPFGIVAAGAALHYLGSTQHNKVDHITRLLPIEETKYVRLDRFTIRNLELLNTSNKQAASLVNVLDQTITPMGGRLLKRWIVLPLQDEQAINQRLDVVSYFTENGSIIESFKGSLKQIGDLERLIAKVAANRITPRETVQLNRSLLAVAQIKELGSQSANKAVSKLAGQLHACRSICDEITRVIEQEAPVMVNKGNVIRKGVNQQLDELRAIAYEGKDYLLRLQERLIQETGINKLKLGYTNVFGYYIEVRNTHKDKVPAGWIRKQTMKQAERYITEELKEYESKILGAEEKIIELETSLFNELVADLATSIQPIQQNSALIARLDCLLSFAVVAINHGYSRPIINQSLVIDIKAGRHPVIEHQLPPGTTYVSNDVYLDNESQQILMITGPNMSGKSAVLRQTALIVLMAQMGCFVPADAATIGLVDKVFTRVGASDNISAGESTFMVEMNETACILNNLTNRSLVLLDEIGRGTSTYDGISIAWSIAEFLHEHPTAKAKTLFATHYHELNEMAATFARIKNYTVAVKQFNQKIIFLHQLVRGGSEHSFGIHVAKMAGMPTQVVKKANRILTQLENKKQDPNLEVIQESVANEQQLSFFQLEDPILAQVKHQLSSMDLNSLTPLDALVKLNELKAVVMEEV